MANDQDLEAFIDETIRKAAAKKYHPTAFIQMRSRWGTREAIKRLVLSGDIQSGLLRLKNLDLLSWSIEAAVIRFPSHFDTGTREAAEFRLGLAQKD
jgi:hypothetical protein